MTLGSLFQGFHHHCFVRLMWHVKSVLVRSKFVSAGRRSVAERVFPSGKEIFGGPGRVTLQSS